MRRVNAATWRESGAGLPLTAVRCALKPYPDGGYRRADESATQPRTSQTGRGPSIWFWVGFWLLAFISAIILKHRRHPEYETGELLLQGLLDSFPVAGVAS